MSNANEYQRWWKYQNLSAPIKLFMHQPSSRPEFNFFFSGYLY